MYVAHGSHDAWTDHLQNPADRVSYLCAWLALVPQGLCVIYATLIWSNREIEIMLMFVGQMGCEALNWCLKRLIKEERPQGTFTHSTPFGTHPIDALQKCTEKATVCLPRTPNSSPSFLSRWLSSSFSAMFPTQPRRTRPSPSSNASCCQYSHYSRPPPLL